MRPNKLPSAAEMAALDAATISSGTMSQELMERAGLAISEVVGSRFTGSQGAIKKVLILCGPGNNGGDGFVVGRILRERGAAVKLILVAGQRFSPDCVEQAGRFEGAGGEILLFRSESSGPAGCSPKMVSASDARTLIAEAELIIDALLGVGQRNAPRGAIKELLELADDSLVNRVAREEDKAVVIAVDVPTGIDCDTGEVFDPHITADLTVTIQLIKRGMLQSPALETCGEIQVVDIGIETSGACEFALLTGESLPEGPKRTRDIHKGGAGRILIIGGSETMLGAPLLSAIGALRSGSGHVFVTRPQCEMAGWACSRPLEVIDLPLTSSELSIDDVEGVLLRASQMDAVVIGPGLGQSGKTSEALFAILARLRQASCKVVLDADALNILATSPGYHLKSDWIVTPHPGEAGRLIDLSPERVQQDRFAAAREAANRLRCTVVLKGASTVIYSGARGWVNSSGNMWMATPGSGDVLAGIIGALAGQGMEPAEAAQRGVYLHGRAGDLAHAAHKGPIIASDIANKIPEAFGLP